MFKKKNKPKRKISIKEFIIKEISKQALINTFLEKYKRNQRAKEVYEDAVTELGRS